MPMPLSSWEKRLKHKLPRYRETYLYLESARKLSTEAYMDVLQQFKDHMWEQLKGRSITRCMTDEYVYVLLQLLKKEYGHEPVPDFEHFKEQFTPTRPMLNVDALLT